MTCEEEIYRTLEEAVNEDKYQEFYYKHHGGSAYGYGRTCTSKTLDSTDKDLNKSLNSHSYYMAVDREEDIYEDLCSFKWNNRETIEGSDHFGTCAGTEKEQHFGTIGKESTPLLPNNHIELYVLNPLSREETTMFRGLAG